MLRITWAGRYKYTDPEFRPTMSQIKRSPIVGKTFDQMRREPTQRDLFDPEKTSPHVALHAAMTFEPNTHQGVRRVRVTARDENLEVLWGANVSEGMLDPERPTEVAFYSTLRELIRRHLPADRPKFETTDDPYESLRRSLSGIRDWCADIEESTVNVKKKSDVTTVCAEAVASLLLDTLRAWSQSLRDAGVSRKTAGKDAEGRRK